MDRVAGYRPHSCPPFQRTSPATLGPHCAAADATIRSRLSASHQIIPAAVATAKRGFVSRRRLPGRLFGESFQREPRPANIRQSLFGDTFRCVRDLPMRLSLARYVRVSSEAPVSSSTSGSVRREGCPPGSGTWRSAPSELRPVALRRSGLGDSRSRTRRYRPPSHRPVPYTEEGLVPGEWRLYAPRRRA